MFSMTLFVSCLVVIVICLSYPSAEAKTLAELCKTKNPSGEATHRITLPDSTVVATKVKLTNCDTANGKPPLAVSYCWTTFSTGPSSGKWDKAAGQSGAYPMYEDRSYWLHCRTDDVPTCELYQPGATAEDICKQAEHVREQVTRTFKLSVLNKFETIDIKVTASCGDSKAITRCSYNSAAVADAEQTTTFKKGLAEYSLACFGGRSPVISKKE